MLFVIMDSRLLDFLKLNGVVFKHKYNVKLFVIRSMVAVSVKEAHLGVAIFPILPLRFYFLLSLTSGKERTIETKFLKLSVTIKILKHQFCHKFLAKIKTKAL